MALCVINNGYESVSERKHGICNGFAFETDSPLGVMATMLNFMLTASNNLSKSSGSASNERVLFYIPFSSWWGNFCLMYELMWFAQLLRMLLTWRQDFSIQVSTS